MGANSNRDQTRLKGSLTVYSAKHVYVQVSEFMHRLSEDSSLPAIVQQDCQPDLTTLPGF